MEFEIKTGKRPVDLTVQSGAYRQLQQALADAAVGEWLYIETDLATAEKARAAITSGSTTKLMRSLRDAGYKSRTAVRTHKHDVGIPEGTAMLFFRKIRA